MLRTIFILTSLAIVGCASHSTHFQAEDFTKGTTFTVAFSDKHFQTDPEDRSQACSADYTAVLQKAATKDEHALERLFYISAHSRWDAAGAEVHFSHMRRMLLVWGDIDFGRVLARQPPATRRGVLHTLEWPDPALPELFPHTYAAATHDA